MFRLNVSVSPNFLQQEGLDVTPLLSSMPASVHPPSVQQAHQHQRAQE